jgi:hypothetical protein
MARILIGLLLIVHGLISVFQAPGAFGRGTANPAWTSWWPTPLGRSWLLKIVGWENTATSWLAASLWVVAGLCFLGAAFGLFANQEWWRTLAVIGALISLLVLAVYFHPFYVPVIVLNAGIAIALVWFRWPTSHLVGS